MKSERVSYGKQAAPTGDHLVEQIRLWLAEISDARESMHQVDRFGLLLSLTVGLLATTLLLLAAKLGFVRQPFTATWMYATLAVCAATLAVFIFRPAYSRYVSFFLAASISLSASVQH